MSASTNRRTFDRYPCEMEILVRPKSEPSDESMATTLENISVGGMLCQFEKPLSRGIEVEISINIPQHEDRFMLDGQVRHSSSKGSDSYLVGFQFLEIRDASPQAFRAYIEALFM